MKIAYVAFLGSAEIYVMNENGTGQINLTNTMTAAERNPSWSVTGKIAYERDGQIWVMNRGRLEPDAVSGPYTADADCAHMVARRLETRFRQWRRDLCHQRKRDRRASGHN